MADTIISLVGTTDSAMMGMHMMHVKGMAGGGITTQIKNKKWLDAREHDYVHRVCIPRIEGSMITAWIRFAERFSTNRIRIQKIIQEVPRGGMPEKRKLAWMLSGTYSISEHLPMCVREWDIMGNNEVFLTTDHSIADRSHRIPAGSTQQESRSVLDIMTSRHINLIPVAPTNKNMPARRHARPLISMTHA